MRQSTVALIHALLAAALISGTAQAGLLSKTYEYRAGVTLEVGASTEDGVRLDTVRFQLPSATAVRTASEATVSVTLSNTAEESKRVGIGIALFDGDGRMVGVVSGGTKFVPIKAGTQRIYKLIFEHVYIEAPQAQTFQISVETKP